MQYQKFRIRSLTVALSVVAMLLVLLLLGQLHVLPAQQAVAIAVAAVIAVAGWWAAARLRGTIDLEAKASNEFITAISEYSGELRELANGQYLYLTTVAIPNPVPPSFFQDLANEYYSKLYNQHIKVVKTHTKLRESYEANEVALVKLDDHFSYIKFKHDELIEQFGDLTQKFVGTISGISNETDFVKAAKILDPLSQSLIMQLMMCLDLKKEVLNIFQAKFFGYTLKPRQPLLASEKNKTLQGLATPETVAAMRKQRDDKFKKDAKVVSLQ